MWPKLRKTANNIPFSQEVYVKKVKNNVLKGTGLKPGEKVIIMLETLEKEERILMVGVMSAEKIIKKEINKIEEQNGLTCIPVSLLNISKELKKEINQRISLTLKEEIRKNTN